MIFRNSLSITTNKFTLIYKVLLYIIIIIVSRLYKKFTNMHSLIQKEKLNVNSNNKQKH